MFCAGGKAFCGDPVGGRVGCGKFCGEVGFCGGGKVFCDDCGF